MREFSGNLLKKQDSYSPKEAESLFEKGWGERIEKMKSVLKPENHIESDVINTITQEFDLRTYGFKSAKACRELVDKFKLNGFKILMSHAETQIKDRALVSLRGTVAKNPDSIIKFDSSKRKFVKNYPKEPFYKV